MSIWVLPDELDITLPPRPESVAEARHATEDVLDGLSKRTRHAVRLIVSELVTNALKYGPRAPIRLWVRRDGATVLGEVEDEGNGVIEIRREAELDSGGFGLRIVDEVSDRWGVREGSTRVWFELSDPS